MVSIHPTAIVDAGAALGVDVEIGPFAIVQAGAQLGDRCRLGPHVVIYGRTTLGADCQVEAGAALGGDAQDLKCDTEDTYLEIGERNVIREYVTIHRSNHAGGVTRVGSDNLLMGFVHVGHDGVLGSHIQMANLATLAGHVEVRDRVVIGGLPLARSSAMAERSSCTCPHRPLLPVGVITTALTRLSVRARRNIAITSRSVSRSGRNGASTLDAPVSDNGVPSRT